MLVGKTRYLSYFTNLPRDWYPHHRSPLTDRDTKFRAIRKLTKTLSDKHSNFTVKRLVAHTAGCCHVILLSHKRGRKRFIMDNDQCQQSLAAKIAIKEEGCELFCIPARSPDLSTIELKLVSA